MLALCSVILLIPSANAQVDSDWNISDDWDEDIFPTPSPTPLSEAQRQYNTFIGYVFAAIMLLGVVPLVITILFFTRGNMDSKTAAVLLIVIVTIIIFFLILLYCVSAFSNIPIGG